MMADVIDWVKELDTRFQRKGQSFLGKLNKIDKNNHTLLIIYY